MHRFIWKLMGASGRGTQLSEEVRKVTFDQDLEDEKILTRKRRNGKIFQAKGIMYMANCMW